MHTLLRRSKNIKRSEDSVRKPLFAKSRNIPSVPPEEQNRTGRYAKRNDFYFFPLIPNRNRRVGGSGGASRDAGPPGRTSAVHLPDGIPKCFGREAASGLEVSGVLIYTIFFR